MNGARGGFALIPVLALVAMLSLVFLSAAAALAVSLQAARAALDGAEFQRLAFTAEAQALFRVSTSSFAPDGLQSPGAGPQPSARPAPLRLDGRGYPWGGKDPGLAVSMQDEAGLVNVDASRPDALLRLFAALGLSATDAETLRDQLLDALDADETPRPRGAEMKDYAARGLRPPLRGGFAALADLGALPDWPRLMDGPRGRRLRTLAAADPTSNAFNVNTASAEVLRIVLAVDGEQARRIVAAREAAPLTSLAQAGLRVAEPGARLTRPSGRVRFTLTDMRRSLSYTSRLAPAADAGGPPWVASTFLIERGRPAAEPLP